MDAETKKAEEAFWGKIPEDMRDQVATDIATQILDRPHGQLDCYVGVLHRNCHQHPGENRSPRGQRQYVRRSYN